MYLIYSYHKLTSNSYLGHICRETLDNYSLEVKNLAKALIAQMEKAIGIENKEVSKIFEDGNQAIMMNYYPPCPEPKKVIGLNAHSDVGGLTILFQVTNVDGLQVKKNGMWVPIKAIPSAFIINVGDAFEVRSIDHYFKSIA